MQTNSRWIAVVALALFDEEGHLLLQERLAGKQHGGMWEFPGGKVEPGEEPRDALCRELAEELGVEVRPHELEPTLFAEETSAGRVIVLMLYRVQAKEIAPHGRDGQQWGWFSREEAAQLPLAPMDRDLLERLPERI